MDTLFSYLIKGIESVNMFFLNLLPDLPSLNSLSGDNWVIQITKMLSYFIGDTFLAYYIGILLIIVGLTTGFYIFRFIYTKIPGIT